MYASSKKTRAAAQRSAERRQREDDAPRLKHEVPDLTSLRISILEHSQTGSTKHLRHVIVDRAPALFVVPCGDARCEQGGHDITAEVMMALRGHRSHYEGEHVCDGTTGSAPCGRRINYEVIAEYAKS